MFYRKMNLQLFAETDGTTGASSATQTADNQPATGTQTAETSGDGSSQIATGGAGGEMSFEELISGKHKKEFEAKVKEIVKTRTKGHKELQGRMEKINPVLEMFGKRYGIDVNNMTDETIDAIVSRVLDDNSFYEEEAMARGIDVEVYKTLQRTERENAALRKFQQEAVRTQESQQRFLTLHREAESLKELYPDFDLDEEMSNPTFQRLAWSAGVPLKTVYETIHHDEIMARSMQVVAQQTAQQISNSIQAGARRPAENGISQQSASLSTKKNFSKEDLEDIRRRVKNGERVVL